MMLQDFRTRIIDLLGTPAVPVLFGRGPRDGSPPYVRVHRVAGSWQGGIAGRIDHSTAILQLDVCASTYKACVDMTELLREGLHGYSAGTIQGSFLEAVRDMPVETDIEDALFMIQMDFNVVYCEPTA